jgi:hypothetical protein
LPGTIFSPLTQTPELEEGGFVDVSVPFQDEEQACRERNDKSVQEQSRKVLKGMRQTSDLCIVKNGTLNLVETNFIGNTSLGTLHRKHFIGNTG